MKSRPELLLPGAVLLSATVFLIHPDVPSKGQELLDTVDAHGAAWAWSHGLGFLDGILWVAAGLALADLLRPHRRRAAGWTKWLVMVGGVAMSSICAAELMFLKIVAGLDGQRSPTMADQFDFGGTGLPIGPLVVAELAGVVVAVCAFWRAGVAPAWLVPAAVAGSVLVWAPSDGLVHWIPVVGELVRLIVVTVLLQGLAKPARRPAAYAPVPAA